MNISMPPYRPAGYGYRQYSSAAPTPSSAPKNIPQTSPSSAATVPVELKQTPGIITLDLERAYVVNISGQNGETYQAASVQAPASAQSNTEKLPDLPNDSPNGDNGENKEDSSSSINQNEDKTNTSSDPSDTGNTQLSDHELKILSELKKADAEVRSHEMAHIAAGGQYVTSGAKLEFRKGPDGQNYAVAGEVSINSSPIPGDPRATAEKMRQIQQAALAPASPSSQDRKVASRASALAAKALSELMIQQVKERTAGNEEQALGSVKQAADNYSRVHGLPMEQQNNSLNISV